MMLQNNSILPLSFQIKCDDFNIEYYGNTTRPKEFTSVLKVIEEGQIVQERTIEVNDPLIHNGIYFYQSGYEKAPQADIILTILLKNDPKFSQKVVLNQGSQISVPIHGSVYQLHSLGTNIQLQNMGENIQVALFKDGKSQGEFTLFKNYPDFDCQFRAKEGLCFSIDGFQEKYFTVLSVGYNPGIPIVWTGCFMLVIGIIWILVKFSRKNNK